MEENKIELDEQFNEDMENCHKLREANDQLKGELEIIDELKKENTQLRQKIEEVSKSDMELFGMDSAPVVDNMIDKETKSGISDISKQAKR